MKKYGQKKNVSHGLFACFFFYHPWTIFLKIKWKENEKGSLQRSEAAIVIPCHSLYIIFTQKYDVYNEPVDMVNI